MAFQYPPSPHTLLPPPPLSTNITLPHDLDDDMQRPTTPTQFNADFAFTSGKTSEAGLSPSQLLSPRTPLKSRARYGPLAMSTPNTALPSPRGGRPSLGSQPPSWKIASDASSSSSSPASRSPRMQHVHSPVDMQQQQYGKPTVLQVGPRRRQSRFDPMGREDEDDEGYGDLGQRHPLRRVAEEDAKESGDRVSLPSIKALFGVAGEHQPPTSGSSVSLHASPSLPSLIPNSPSSSPSTARTSRYSSLTSQMSSTSDIFQPPNVGGWWAPDFDRGSMSSTGSSSPRHPPSHRANSYPSVLPFSDEHADKRRRSDGPPALRDAEESARLRWQAQSRNASFPTTNSPLGTPSSGLRSLLHPPQSASAAMSRQSISAGSGFSSPLTPFHEHPPGEFPFETRKIAPVPSRSASIVGGQLAQSFADLTATEQLDRRSSLAQTEMRPPLLVPDRRLSSIQPSPSVSRESSPRPSLPPLTHNRPPSVDPIRRQSVTRPPSPDHSGAALRRSSLAELIMASSGDDVAMANGQFNKNPSFSSVPLAKSSLSEPVPPNTAAPLITGWPSRRLSAESVISAPGISLNSDGEGLTPPSIRNKRRTVHPPQNDEDVDMNGENAMRGMEVLAESAAQRVQEAERDQDDDPLKGGMINQPGGPGVGPKYACAFCAKTFSRPSSLRIHTYSHTGERPFICEEPSCRRRFSVQSNLKRHAKVHVAGGGDGKPAENGTSNGESRVMPNGPLGAGSAHVRPIERAHRHPIPPQMVQGYYRSSHPPPQYPPSHPGLIPPGYAPYGHTGYDRYPQPGHVGQGEGRIHPPPVERGKDVEQEEEWDEEEDELEEDELEEEMEEEE